MVHILPILFWTLPQCMISKEPALRDECRSVFVYLYIQAMRDKEADDKKNRPGSGDSGR